MEISYPTNTGEIITAIRNAIGRPVIFNIEHKTDCPACVINPITNLSTNPFCVVCSGEGWITTVSGVTISGHVTWNPSETLQWNEGGQWKQYDCRVQIEYTTDNVYVVDNADNAIVDGKKLKVKNVMPRGFRELNRLVIALSEE